MTVFRELLKVLEVSTKIFFFNLISNFLKGDNLKFPKKLKKKPAFIEKIHINFGCPIDQFEEELCKYLEEDRRNRNRSGIEESGICVIERRLKVVTF